MLLNNDEKNVLEYVLLIGSVLLFIIQCYYSVNIINDFIVMSYMTLQRLIALLLYGAAFTCEIMWIFIFIKERINGR